MPSPSSHGLLVVGGLRRSFGSQGSRTSAVPMPKIEPQCVDTCESRNLNSERTRFFLMVGEVQERRGHDYQGHEEIENQIRPSCQAAQLAVVPGSNNDRSCNSRSSRIVVGCPKMSLKG